jgi:hypothetical protein
MHDRIPQTAAGMNNLVKRLTLRDGRQSRPGLVRSGTNSPPAVPSSVTWGILPGRAVGTAAVLRPGTGVTGSVPLSFRLVPDAGA